MTALSALLAGIWFLEVAACHSQTGSNTKSIHTTVLVVADCQIQIQQHNTVGGYIMSDMADSSQAIGA